MKKERAKKPKNKYRQVSDIITNNYWGIGFISKLFIFNRFEVTIVKDKYYIGNYVCLTNESELYTDIFRI